MCGTQRAFFDQHVMDPAVWHGPCIVGRERTAGTNCLKNALGATVLCVTLFVQTAGTNVRCDFVMCHVVCARQWGRTVGATVLCVTLCVQNSGNEL